MAQLCIDIGGTNTLLGVGNGDLSRKQTLDTESFLADMDAGIETALAGSQYKKSDITEVKVAAAGPVDTTENPVFYPPNIDQEEVSLEPLTAIGEFHLYNDCHAAAMGEYHESETDDRLVYITISTGIGGGVVDGGTLQTGTGNAGEIGHIPTGHDQIRCGCGGTDHWEAHCGGAKLPDVAKHLYDVSYEDARALFTAYREGSKKTEPVIDHVRRHCQRGLIGVINAYDPAVIRIGGGIGANHFDILFEGIEQDLADDLVTDTPVIEPARLGEQSVLQGLSRL